MRTAFLIMLLTSAAASAAAQSTSSLEGRISDERGNPIGAARIEIPAARLSRLTDGQGHFRIGGLTPGRHEVRVRAVGYLPVSRSVLVEPGQPFDLSISLAPAPVALAEIEVRATPPPGSVRPAEDITGQLVLAGARTEVIQLAGTPVNLAEKNARQVFAKVPGVFVYDMDGSGNQINIATRGLDPHRSWELNVRQDGVLVNSDLYGYPASHYSLPLEAVGRIEHVRGTAALQYGSQFGGMINYLSRVADSGRTAQPELLTSTGSNGLVSGFGSVGGTAGGLTYYGYATVRQSDGYRTNATSSYNAQYLALSGALSSTLSLRGQIGRSYYRYRIPGPLNDSMFRANPRASTRTRNWFSPDIIVPAVALDWRPRPGTRLTIQGSGVFGSRSSVQFVGFATTPDALAPGTGQFGNRQVDIDNFRSTTTEARLTHEYGGLGIPATLAAGFVYSNNDLHRRQQGRGTTGTDYDLALVSGDFGRDIHYRTANVAFFAENLLRLTPRLSLIPGVRVEHGRTKLTGRLAYYDPADVPTNVRHDYPLFGLRTEYRVFEMVEAYGGWSQAYRPMILKDVLPENALERTDPNLRDARGWTFEAGIRGRLGRRVTFDVGGFALRYNNRFGTLLQSDGVVSQIFKTNVGSSLTKGIEIAAEAQLLGPSPVGLSVFTATSFYDAKYREGTVVSAGQNRSIIGNRVEAVPRWISRSGVTLIAGRISGTATISRVASTFADALNTVTPSANGAVGLVPGYTLLDLGLSVGLARWVQLRSGITNALDRHYFTKRPTFYPGPGIWPSDGRAIQLSAEFRW